MASAAAPSRLPPGGDEKLFTTSNGVTYSYTLYHSSPHSKPKPTLLFLHGFPEDRHSWSSQVKHFLSLGYGALVPDLVGVGGTDKSSDPSEYRIRKICESLADILDHEGLPKIVIAAHDWGVGPGARFNLYFPERVLANVFTSALYTPPGKEKRTLKDANDALEKRYGYRPMAYWELFKLPEASAFLLEHLDSAVCVLFPAAHTEVWRNTLGAENGIQNFLAADTIVPIAPYFPPHEQAEFKKRVRRDGFATGYYRAAVEYYNFDDEVELDPIIRAPSLQIMTTKDPLSSLDAYVELEKTVVADLEVINVDTGHWVMRESPETWNKTVEEYLGKKFC